MSISNEDENS